MPILSGGNPTYNYTQGPFRINLDSPQAVGLVRWWPMNGVFDSGSLVREMIVGHDVTFTSPVWDSNHVRGYGPHFHGSGYIDTGVTSMGGINFFLNPGGPGNSLPFTLTGWARLRSATSGTVWGRAGATNVNRTFQLLYNGVSEAPAVIIRGVYTYFTPQSNNDEWHLHAIRYDGTNAGYWASRSSGQAGVSGVLNIGTAVEETTERMIFGARTNGTGFRLTDAELSDFRLYDRVLGDDDLERMYLNESRYELLQPTGIPKFWLLPLDTSQYSRPASDAHDGAWKDQSGGGSLFEALNEDMPDDADYIISEDGPVVVALSGLSDPGSSSGHVLRYRYKKDASPQMDLTVQLRQGYVSEASQGTLIAEWIHTNISSTLTTSEQTLTAPQADAITDYSALSVRMVAVKP